MLLRIAGEAVCPVDHDAGLLIAGLVSKVISAAATPSADTRAWENLPNLIGFAAFRLPEGNHLLKADFVDGSGAVTLSRDISIKVETGTRDTVIFLSDRP